MVLRYGDQIFEKRETLLLYICGEHYIVSSVQVVNKAQALCDSPLVKQNLQQLSISKLFSFTLGEEQYIQMVVRDREEGDYNMG